MKEIQINKRTYYVHTFAEARAWLHNMLRSRIQTLPFPASTEVSDLGQRINATIRAQLGFGAEASIHIDCGTEPELNERAKVRGTPYQHLEVRVNYPTTGSEPVSVVQTRVAFLARVVELAAFIEAEIHAEKILIRD